MKQVSIVGLGMSADTLTSAGLSAVNRADVLIGTSSRLIAPFAKLGKPCFTEYIPEKVASIINQNKGSHVCILVSGDTGFYSVAEGLCAELNDLSISLIPGISSLSYFLARLKYPWQDVKAISCHGRRVNLTDTVRRHHLTFALTGGNLSAIGEILTQAGFGELLAHAGENLGMAEEKIITLPVSELSQAGIGKLSVLLVENPGYDQRIRYGIPDEEFIRGPIPMTKAETRAVTLSKLKLFPRAVCCDIGAGTGSVTVEMALAAYEGQVYSLDKNEEALKLVKANCRAFHIGNVTPVSGLAPEALEKMPFMNAAFIGGTSGRIKEILASLLNNNPHMRIVVNVVTLETLHEATQAFTLHNLKPDIIQLGVIHANQSGNLHMLQAASPVFILSGGGGKDG